MPKLNCVNHVILNVQIRGDYQMIFGVLIFSGIAGHVTVGNNVTIGALTTIHQFCQMGDYSFAGMNASITMDVPSYIKVASNPARVVGLNSVGMERGGIDQETITILKKAYKIIYRKGFNNH